LINLFLKGCRGGRLDNNNSNSGILESKIQVMKIKNNFLYHKVIECKNGMIFAKMRKRALTVPFNFDY